MNRVITIDGPAGAGKSTVARRLAERLGFQFLDTGAMYRAVTWATLKRDVDVDDQDSVATIAAEIKIDFDGDRVLVDDSDATDEIRSLEVTNNVSEIADNRSVREQLVMLQRKIASVGDYVCEGRDQGTVVFPHADCKIFLTASSAERAQRRLEQIRSAGADVEFESILKEQELRDQRDQVRPVGQLRKADDAIEITSDNRSIDEVVGEIESIVKQRCFDR